ncbi:MAG: hypothetical protein M1819_002316 [Sarea resinae]|nr:MAG: hypothetical protein M1819_002316 [Sarea resinae]
MPSSEPYTLPGVTFGVEIEFFAAVLMKEFNKTEFETLRHLLGAKLEKLRLAGPDSHGTEIEVVSDETFEGLEDYEDKPADQYTAWTVTRDESAMPEHPELFEECECQPLELVSPPYPANLRYWIQDLVRVLGMLDNADVLNPPIIAELNDNTHLHVHIGNGTAGFTTRTVRNLAILWVSFEDDIDRMLWRSLKVDNAWARPNSRSSTLGGLSILDRARAISNFSQTIAEVVEIMCPRIHPHDPPRYYKANFQSLLSRKKTVEFRHHDGTFNAETMIRWISFVTSLVELAHVVPNADLFRLLNARATIQDDDWALAIAKLLEAMETNNHNPVDERLRTYVWIPEDRNAQADAERAKRAARESYRGW